MHNISLFSCTIKYVFHMHWNTFFINKTYFNTVLKSTDFIDCPLSLHDSNESSSKVKGDDSALVDKINTTT